MRNKQNMHKQNEKKKTLPREREREWRNAEQCINAHFSIRRRIKLTSNMVRVIFENLVPCITNTIHMVNCAHTMHRHSMRYIMFEGVNISHNRLSLSVSVFLSLNSMKKTLTHIRHIAFYMGPLKKCSMCTLWRFIATIKRFLSLSLFIAFYSKLFASTSYLTKWSTENLQSHFHSHTDAYIQTHRPKIIIANVIINADAGCLAISLPKILENAFGLHTHRYHIRQFTANTKS